MIKSKYIKLIKLIFPFKHMVFKQYITLVLFCLCFDAYSSQNTSISNENTLKKVEQFIFQEQNDSAIHYLNTIPNSPISLTLREIANGKPSYSHILDFMQILSDNYIQNVEKLNKLISKVVEEPKTKDSINLDYVKIRWHQIVRMLNQEMLVEAAVLSKDLKNYINSIHKQNEANVLRAKIYADIYDIVLFIIQGDVEKLKDITLNNEKKAIALQDTFLIIYSKYYYSQYLYFNKDLDGYISVCEEALKLEKNLPVKTLYYFAVFEQLIDASIYKGGFDENHILGLLYEMYTSRDSKYNSFSLYAKLLKATPMNSATHQKIYKQFNVTGLEAFCDTVISQSQEQNNSNELLNLYNHCSEALFKHDFVKKAFIFKNKCISITKKIYSQELAQTIADYQTKEVEQAKAIENGKLQATIAKQKIIVWTISIAILIFSVLLWFLFQAVKQRNKTNKQLASANNDLKRLNVLNQKIFTVISHDFKTPMLTLSMLVNGFKKKTADAQMLDHINEVSNQFDNANTILNNLLNWSKTEIAVAHDLQESCNLNEIVDETVLQVKLLAQAKGISFDCEIPENTIVKLPPDILKIVLRNLVSNAIKFSYENAVVKIVFDKQSGLLKVIDHGTGIKPEKLTQLFNKDVISSFGTNKEPGFGIGLYIVHELLYKYNCGIRVQSELEKETIFTINFN
jgi:two-component system, sensor histidine kinase PdtaS